jgi:hypothetical protein
MVQYSHRTYTNTHVYVKSSLGDVKYWIQHKWYVNGCFPRDLITDILLFPWNLSNSIGNNGKKKVCACSVQMQFFPVLLIHSCLNPCM